MASYKVVGFIYKIGVNRCIDIPNEISKKLGDENFIPVVIRAAYFIKRTNLIPSGDGHKRLFLDSDIRRNAGKDTGQFIEIEISRDKTPRDVIPPEDLLEELNMNVRAKVTFENMTVNQKREIVDYLNSAKQQETRLKRLEYITAVLLERAGKKKRRGK